MSGASPALDEAFDRMARLDFELPNGFVNHGPMACEALAQLDLDDQIDGWARWFVQMVGEGPEPVAPRSFGGSGWEDALGDYQRLPEWIGSFDQAIAETGWASVVELWVPRLMPGLITALFHGVIRTAHAVRAIDTAETPSRQAELARALGYWAARFRPGQPVGSVAGTEHVDRAVLATAALGARHYVAQPNIYNLHGVTGAMAVDLLVDHIGPDAGVNALAQVQAEHAAMYRSPGVAVPEDRPEAWDTTVDRAAANSRDAHQVKLVEACRRGYASTNDRSFVIAARRAVGG